MFEKYFTNLHLFGTLYSKELKDKKVKLIKNVNS